MNVKQKVSEILQTSGTEYFSGAQLAKQLGVSRNAVWKAIQELKKQGFPIETKHSVGYRMTQSIDLITLEKVKSYLHTKNLGATLYVLSTVDSTNDYCRHLLLEGAPHGTVVVANEQTAGKGRQGRVFHSPAGAGLYFSVVIKKKLELKNAYLLTACAAVATARAIDALYHTHTQIKWVNDLFLNGKKCCGILTESAFSLESGQLEYAILGIGINIRNTRENMPPELREIVTSLEEETEGLSVYRSELLAAILYELEELLPNLVDRTFLSEYRSRSFLLGKNVELIQDDGTHRRVAAVDISNDCALVVRDRFGSVEAIHSGKIGRILES